MDKIRAVAVAQEVDLSAYTLVPTEHSHAAAEKEKSLSCSTGGEHGRSPLNGPDYNERPDARAASINRRLRGGDVYELGTIGVKLSAKTVA